MIDIGKQITAMRRERDMTQEQLATLIGVSAQTVSKWECGTTMPDILLLPVIAEIFETSIDALFGIEENINATALHAEKPEAAIDDLLLRMWCEGAPKKDANFQISQMRKTLDSNRDTQSMWITQSKTGIFIDAETAIVNRMTWEQQIQSLSRGDAMKFLSDCIKPNVICMMQYLLNNCSRAFTAAAAAAKCGITEEEAAAALDILSGYAFTMRDIVDLPDGTVTIYRTWGAHKLLLLSALFSIAEKLADFKESYQGFCN